MIKTSRIILVTSLILIGVWIGGCNLGQPTQETGTQPTSSTPIAPAADIAETPRRFSIAIANGSPQASTSSAA